MTEQLPNTAAAGRFTFAGSDISANRMGFGAMQLAGPHVFGAHDDPDRCIAVLREARALGVDHIDTSDYYGPYVTNDLIREALHPYAADLTLVTKIGAYRDESGGWILRRDADFLRQSVIDNIERLGVDAMDIVNLRMEGPDDDIATPMQAMRAMQEEGLIRHIGISMVSAAQVTIARDIAPVVCVQNMYNLVTRTDDALIDQLAADGIAYVPFFPLGGFSPIQSEGLETVARDLGHTPQQVALAWLLQRSPNILLIPGTSRLAHLRENIAAGAIKLGGDALGRLDGLAAQG